jgi:hypothetical protein
MTARRSFSASARTCWNFFHRRPTSGSSAARPAPRGFTPRSSVGADLEHLGELDDDGGGQVLAHGLVDRDRPLAGADHRGQRRLGSIDPIVQSLGDPASHNPYSYVGNDPVKRVDPDGRGWSDFLIGLLAIALIVVGAVLTYNDWVSGPYLISYGLGLIASQDQGRARWVFLGLAALGS